ncbi:MAG TPA: hypothetical protein DCY59_10130 [Micrococcaceae bacterium]|nr:hypothetical protein [Micrococcaceae bacterium]
METVLGMTDLQIRLFTAIGQIAVALIVGYIAYQQWKTARKKLKADLFDRRLSSYRELTAKVVAVLERENLEQEPEAQMQEVWEIERLGMEMSWTFSPAIGELVESVREGALDVVKARIEFVEAEGNRQRNKEKRAVYAALNELNIRLRGVTASITPFMQLGH